MKVEIRKERERERIESEQKLMREGARERTIGQQAGRKNYFW